MLSSSSSSTSSFSSSGSSESTSRLTSTSVCDGVARTSKPSDGGKNLASGADSTVLPPPQATAAISVSETSTGVTCDGLIQFSAAALGSDGKPSLAAGSMTSDGLIQFSTAVGKSSSAEASTKSSRLVERCSLVDRTGARMHPYRGTHNVTGRHHDSRSHFTFRPYSRHRSIEDLLECHTTSAFQNRQFIEWPVSSQVLIEPSRLDKTPRFSRVTFVRATLDVADRILGATDEQDDLEDVPFTQNDVKHFDRKKRMAEELDKVFDNFLSVDSAN